MPNALTALGLTTATRDELVTYFTAQYQAIYGTDINLDSNTPDGQMMNIFIQSILDLEDLLAQIYNSFDPDNAIGRILDQRVAINGIVRTGGSYTITPITMVIASSVNIYGLDWDQTVSVQPIYTVADNAGNKWFLIDTVLGVTAGTHIYNFRAELPGEQLTIQNTITTQVTIVLGVTSVNNPTSYLTLGENEEADATLKLRRQRATSKQTQGYYNGLVASLETINGVTVVEVFENYTDVTDANDVPPHSIWVIVGGTATDADIAQAIYSKRNAGAGMKGNKSYVITQDDGTLFTVYWDEATTQNIFFTAYLNGLNGTTPNNQIIRDGLAAKLAPLTNQGINVTQIATYIQEIDPNCVPTLMGLSDGKSQTLSLEFVPTSGSVWLCYKTGNEIGEAQEIAFSDSLSTILANLVIKYPALSGITGFGSMASKSITFDLTEIENRGLFYIVLNSLGPGNNHVTMNPNFALAVSPTGVDISFIFPEEDIILYPIQIAPIDPTTAISTTVQFTSAGGYGTAKYDVASGSGTINVNTGLYTASGFPGSGVVHAQYGVFNTNVTSDYYAISTVTVV